MQRELAGVGWLLCTVAPYVLMLKYGPAPGIASAVLAVAIYAVLFAPPRSGFGPLSLELMEMILVVANIAVAVLSLVHLLRKG